MGAFLSDVERQELEKILRSQKREDRLIRDRVRILLKVDEGKTGVKVAQELKLSRQTVYRWCRRFLVRRKMGVPISDRLKDRGESEEEKRLWEIERLRKRLQGIKVPERIEKGDEEKD